MNLETLRQFQDQIQTIADQYGVSNIRVFGSVVRGEANNDSDIDLLVDFEPSIGIEIGRFIMDLQDLLGCRVDVAEESWLHHRIRDQALSEALPL